MSEYRPGYIEGKRKLGVYVDEEMHKALRIMAAETGESMGKITERALRKELAQHGRGRPEHVDSAKRGDTTGEEAKEANKTA